MSRNGKVWWYIKRILKFLSQTDPLPPPQFKLLQHLIQMEKGVFSAMYTTMLTLQIIYEFVIDTLLLRFPQRHHNRRSQHQHKCPEEHWRNFPFRFSLPYSSGWPRSFPESLSPQGIPSQYHQAGIKQFAMQVQGGRPSLIQFITFTFSFLIGHLFTSWSITFSTTNPTFLSLWLPLPQGISWRRHEDISISIKNSLPNHRTEEKRGYLEGGRHRAPILWRTRLRLTLLICWQGPRRNQRRWCQEDSCFACKLLWMQGQSRSSPENEA